MTTQPLTIAAAVLLLLPLAVVIVVFTLSVIDAIRQDPSIGRELAAIFLFGMCTVAAVLLLRGDA